MPGAASTAPGTTSYQPCSDCSYFACQERDLKRLALPWGVTFTHLLIQGPTHSFQQLHISGVSSQVNVPGGNGEVTYQPRPGTLLMETGDYSLGEGEDLGDGEDFNIKHDKNKKKLPFSQEQLQTLLYQDKAPKPARSVFTKTASLRTAKPDFQSKRVPILAAALQTRPSIPPRRAPKQQHLLRAAAWVPAGMSPAILAQPQRRRVCDSTMIPHPPSRLHINHPSDDDLLTTLHSLYFSLRGF